MNINFIYEGNEYQFDVTNDVRIKYIKELAQKIFLQLIQIIMINIIIQ